MIIGIPPNFIVVEIKITECNGCIISVVKEYREKEITVSIVDVAAYNLSLNEDTCIHTNIEDK